MALTDLLTRVDELKCEIDKLRPIKPEQERRIMDKFRLDWNYHSNAIEGNQLTLGETKVLLMEGLTAHGKPLKDSLDIKGHNEVISFLEAFVQKREALTEATIRGLHKILLHEPYQVEARTPDGQVTKKWVKLGEYKTEPNFAQSPTGERRHFILPQDVPAKMHDLMDWYKTESDEKTLHPIVFAAVFHHKFVSIHPFDDGNGRMARILMNLIAMQNGFQPIVIKTQRKEQYISALVKADAGETAEFLDLIVEEEIYSEELFLKGAKGEDISDFDDIDKKIALLKQELSNIAEPLQLNVEIQKEFIGKNVKPCFNRLVRKLGQFNELYSENIFAVTAVQWANSNFTSQTGWNPSPPPTKDNIIERVERTLIQQGVLFNSIQFIFNWKGFKRAGTNTFSDSCTLIFQFQQYKYHVQANHPDGTVFNFGDVYQISLSEEQILKIVKGLTEACFKHIEQQVRRKK